MCGKKDKRVWYTDIMVHHDVNKRSIVIYTDGASRGNPGPSSIGIYIETLGKKYGEVIENTTNNDAEYQALVTALKKVKSLLGKARAKQARIECRMDSELAVKQLSHEYKILHPTTQKHFLAVWNLCLDFGSVVFKHVPREENAIADGLANEVLDRGSSKLF